jgi:hypothetical protein
MLYTTEEYNKIINNAIDAAGIANVKVNGVPVGHISGTTELAKYGNILTQPVVANDFINALYNQFIYRATAENYFTSPFDYFRERREGFAIGSYEVDVQPVFPLAYDMKAFDRILDFWETPAIVQYFAINRRHTFPQTITKQMVKDAFISYDDLDNFTAKLVMAPRKGNVIVETNAVKMMLNKNIAAGAVIKKAFTEPQTEDGWKALAAEIVGIAQGMSAEPTTEYNNYKNIQGAKGEAWTQSDTNDLVLIGTTDIIAKLKTYVLAFAYNKEDVELNFKFIPLNSFNYSTYNEETRAFENKQISPVKLLLCDGGFIKFEDNLDEEYNNTNGMTMGIQHALQIQQTIDIRVFRNAVAFVDADSELVTNTMRIADDNPVKYLTDVDEETTVKLNGGTVPEGGVTVAIKSATFGKLGGKQTTTNTTEANNYFYCGVGANKNLTDGLKKIASGDAVTPIIKINNNNPIITGAKDYDYLTVVVSINDSEFTIISPALGVNATSEG